MFLKQLNQLAKKLILATFVSLLVMLVPIFVLTLLKWSVDYIFNDGELTAFLDHVYIFFLSIDVMMVFIIFYWIIFLEPKKDKTKA